MYMDDISYPMATPAYTNPVQDGATDHKMNDLARHPGFSPNQYVVNSACERDTTHPRFVPPTRFVLPVTVEGQCRWGNVHVRNQVSGIPTSSGFSSPVGNQALPGGMATYYRNDAKTDIDYVPEGLINLARNRIISENHGNATQNAASEAHVNSFTACNIPNNNLNSDELANKKGQNGANIPDRFSCQIRTENLDSHHVRHGTEFNTGRKLLENETVYFNYNNTEGDSKKLVHVNVNPNTSRHGEGIIERKKESSQKVGDDISENIAAKQFGDDEKEMEVVGLNENSEGKLDSGEDIDIGSEVTDSKTKEDSPFNKRKSMSIEEEKATKQNKSELVTNESPKAKETVCHACENCQKTYKRKDHLMRHMQTAHSDLRPFLCKVCSHTFSRKDRLTRHEKIHSGSPQFTCDNCEKRFFRKDSLRKHLRNGCKKTSDEFIIVIK